MLESLPGGVGIWDEENLALFDFAACAARLHPDASGPELDQSSAWLTWGTYGDDYFPAVFGPTRNMVAAKVFNARLPMFMPLDCDTAPPPANAVEKGLAELWMRTASPMAMPQRRQFRQGVEDMTTSWLWELSNHIQNRIPDPVDYVEMRRKTFGSDLTMNLARIARRTRIPAETFRTRTLRALENSAADYACFTNDIFSYQKEIEFEGQVHNCVLVVQKFLDTDRERAVSVVNDLMTSRMVQFEHVLATELSFVVEDIGLDADASEALNEYVVAFHNWVGGIWTGMLQTGRYPEWASGGPAWPPDSGGA